MFVKNLAFLFKKVFKTCLIEQQIGRIVMDRKLFSDNGLPLLKIEVFWAISGMRENRTPSRNDHFINVVNRPTKRNCVPIGLQRLKKRRLNMLEMVLSPLH